jgi:uncharacterized protein YciI
MNPKEELRAALLARVAGLTKVPFSVIYMEPTAQWVQSAELHATTMEHLDWLEALERDGRLFLSGPIDLATWDGTGMAVLRGTDGDEAVRLSREEPFHARGFRRNSVRTWHVNEGSLTLRVDLMSGIGRLI